MLAQAMNIAGHRFGKLTAIKQVGSDNGAIWLCRCDCGNKVERKGTYLNRVLKRNRNTQITCGCKKSRETHRQSNTSLYQKWCNMKNRCHNKKVSSYHNYGGRGIKIFKLWQVSFVDFYKWAMRSGYEEGMSLERIDVNGDYVPENCKWIPLFKQQSNKRNSRKLTWDGMTLTPREWADKLNVSYEAMQLRVSRNWDIERIFTQPFRRT